MHALWIGSTFGTDDVITRRTSLLPDIFAWGMFSAVMAVFLCNTPVKNFLIFGHESHS